MAAVETNSQGARTKRHRYSCGVVGRIHCDRKSISSLSVWSYFVDTFEGRPGRRMDAFLPCFALDAVEQL